MTPSRHPGGFARQDGAARRGLLAGAGALAAHGQQRSEVRRGCAAARCRQPLPAEGCARIITAPVAAPAHGPLTRDISPPPASARRSEATAARLSGRRTSPAAPRAATIVLVWSPEHHVAILDLVSVTLLQCPPHGLDVGFIIFADHAGFHPCPPALLLFTSARLRFKAACVGASDARVWHSPARHAGRGGHVGFGGLAPTG